MTDQTSPTVVEDDDMPSVSFSLRNQQGEDGTLTIQSPMLGTELFVLITPGDDGPKVEASHLDFDALVGTLAFVLGTAVQHEDVSDETRTMVVEFLTDAVEASRG